jgi:hypothetical protein
VRRVRVFTTHGSSDIVTYSHTHEDVLGYFRPASMQLVYVGL